DPCAALQMRITLEPHGEAECAFLITDSDSEAESAALLEAFSGPADWAEALDRVRRFWADTVGRLQIETPIPEIDRMVNTWLPYQNLSCRLRGRSAFYQSGGAFGFRDQLQDAA